MAIRLIASSFSPRLGRPLGRSFESSGGAAAPAPARIGPVPLAANTYANDALKRAITVAFCIF
jgi:hypothetical protein